MLHATGALGWRWTRFGGADPCESCRDMKNDVLGYVLQAFASEKTLGTRLAKARDRSWEASPRHIIQTKRVLLAIGMWTKQHAVSVLGVRWQELSSKKTLWRGALLSAQTPHGVMLRTSSSVVSRPHYLSAKQHPRICWIWQIVGCQTQEWGK